MSVSAPTTENVLTKIDLEGLSAGSVIELKTANSTYWLTTTSAARTMGEVIRGIAIQKDGDPTGLASWSPLECSVQRVVTVGEQLFVCGAKTSSVEAINRLA